MKIILTLAIIAFCGVLQITVADTTLLELQYKLIEKQFILLNVTEPLLQLKKEIAAPENIAETSAEFTANLTTLLNNATRAIEDKGEAAIRNGKSVVVCVEPALANLTALKNSAFAEYTQAGENITLFALNILNQIDATIELGLSSAMHIFTIPKTCYNNDTDLYTACFADSLKNTSGGVEAYQIAANNVLAAIESETSSFNLLELAIEWVLSVVIIAAEAEAGIETIHKTAIECIEAL